MTRKALIIGYGNVLRSDDGIGWHVAERLAADARFDDVTILQRHQLTPELALDVSRDRLEVAMFPTFAHPVVIIPPLVAAHQRVEQRQLRIDV